MRQLARLSIKLQSILLPGTLLLICQVTGAAAEPAVLFNRDIRPILSDNCFLCHGPAKATRKAGLRLDTREGAFADLGDYRAGVPGKPEESQLWLRVTAAEPAKRMPPPRSGRVLTPRQLELLRLWI